MVEYGVVRNVGRVPEILGVTQKYLIYFGGILVGSMLLFAVLRTARFDSLVSAGVAIAAIVAGFFWMQHLSGKYGEHGATRAAAYSRRPRMVRSRSRRVYFELQRATTHHPS